MDEYLCRIKVIYNKLVKQNKQQVSYMKIQKKQLLVLSAAVMMMLTSCGKLGELSADNFKVVPDPMKSEAGQVKVVINGMFPEKYMKKKAVVTVTPELRYGNGQAVQSKAGTFQGEKVLGNDRTISYRVGGNYTMQAAFDYVPEMQNSELYLVFDAKIGNKAQKVPAVKVATGVIATSELYKETLKSSQACLAVDAFQRVTAAKQEANIKFLIQQATLRQSELKNNSVTEFVKLLERINADREGLMLGNVEVSAYASPDGGLELNDKLAEQRQENTEGFVQKEMDKIKMEGYVDANYTAQDWEGFQELVKASNIQDKEVILRVLSMYKDPEQREQQIKNMSEGFEELKEGILPQLRRARLTINYEVIGRDDDQIVAQYKSDPSQLSVEEMLYCATLVEGYAHQKAVYETTTRLYPKDSRAYNNIGTLEYAKGDYKAAQSWFEKALTVEKNGEALANSGLIALQNGDVEKAEIYISGAGKANGIGEVLGNLNIAKGNYMQAEMDFGSNASNSTALAQILNKNYSAAAKTLSSISNPDGTTEYLKAILNARQNNTSAAKAALAAAIAKDKKWADYAARDIELKNIMK